MALAQRLRLRRRSERKEMRETCSSCSESSPDGEFPSAAGFALTAEAAAAARVRAFPPRGRGVVFVLCIPAGGRPPAASE
jgi:hypothetical protein